MRQASTGGEPLGGDDSTRGRYLPVPIDSLDFRAHDLDLYLAHGDRRPPTLYRAAGVEFTREDAARLEAQGHRFLHIPSAQHGVYRHALSERLDRLFHDTDQCAQERARVIRAACSRMIEEVFFLPGQPGPIESISDLAGQFCRWSEDDPATFSYMLEMSEHDFYTATHMVNVGVGCGLLGAAVCPGDGPLRESLYLGGLLHDVGKRVISAEVLNKASRLSEDEWRQMRLHPLVGFEDLRGRAGIDPRVLEMVRDHHERLDGCGYPNGSRDDRISVPARICAVVDVFDALTAERSYHEALPPLNALEVMEEGRGTKFDPEVFDCWRDLVCGLIAHDPGRAPAPWESERVGSLVDFDLEPPEAIPGSSRSPGRETPGPMLRARVVARLGGSWRPVGSEFAMRVLRSDGGCLRGETDRRVAVGDRVQIDPDGEGARAGRVAWVSRSGRRWEIVLDLRSDAA